MIIRIDQRPAEVPLLLNRGDDLIPFTATLQGVNFSTAAGYVWSARILTLGVLTKTLTVTSILSGSDTVVTVSGLSAAESMALATSGLMWDLYTTSPSIRTFFEGGVSCD